MKKLSIKDIIKYALLMALLSSIILFIMVYLVSAGFMYYNV